MGGWPERGKRFRLRALAHPGRGHRPCHVGTLARDPPGAQGPRPAPAPPSAGASRPPGRALASVGAGCTGLGGSIPHGRGNAVRFLFPPVPMNALSPLQWQGPLPLPQRPADPWPAGGPKPPASARPALGGRFSPAGSGAGLWLCRLHRSWWQRRARAGKRMRFLFPPGSGAEDQTPNRPPRCHGRGHRPCHSATLTLGPPGAQSPRPAPAPPPAGAGLCRCGWHGSWWQRSARVGKRSAFPVPARTGGGRSESEPPTPLQWQGPSPLPQRPADLTPAGGPKPPASARPAPGGRWPAVRLDQPIYGEPSRTGRETQGVSCSRPDRGNSQNANHQPGCAPTAGAIAPATASR
jgi:hypothetical protein